MRSALVLLLAIPSLAAAQAPPPPPPPPDETAPSTKPPPRNDADDAKERASDEERAGEKKQRVDLDLDKRIRPVSGSLFLKSGRSELGPVVGISLSDAFFTKYMVGLRYAYHAGETLSFGAFGMYASSSPSGAVARCDSRGEGCRTPTKANLVHTPGDFNANAGVDVAWAPLYGKISLLAESVLHFDTYVLAGGGGLQTRIAPPGGAAAKESWRPEGHFALGQRYFFAPWGTVRVELRDMLYGIEIQGRQGPVDRLENQLMFNLGLSFFLGSPPEP